ncbi:MAG: indole-3-glycerol phosphate synthase TrpC [Nitrospirota bacterium]|nr:indole-3-glycerol phosphate synthase TrpC [Nitrospirota bacterium]
MSILDEIIKNKREELKNVKAEVPLPEIKNRIKDAEPARSFSSAIRRGQDTPLRLIAELKKASPSNGLIREDFNLSEIVSVYDKKNVAAISVLTEERFFSGRLSYLKQARKRTARPLLRKDFIFDEYQVYEARAAGADALLLIAAALDRSHLGELFSLAKELSLDCLVEVHNWKELDAALYCGAEIIGINNRDLTNLKISLDTTFALLKDIPDDRIVVSESGIRTRDDVKALEATRTDAVLVGTTIMKAVDIGAKIDELMGTASGR